MKAFMFVLVLSPLVAFAGASTTNCKNASGTVTYRSHATGNNMALELVAVKGNFVSPGAVSLVSIAELSYYVADSETAQSGGSIPGDGDVQQMPIFPKVQKLEYLAEMTIKKTTNNKVTLKEFVTCTRTAQF